MSVMEIRRHMLQRHAEGNKAVPGQASTLVLGIQQISITKQVAATRGTACSFSTGSPIYYLNTALLHGRYWYVHLV